MSNNSLAPVRRAFAFFGCMGLVVTALTLGAGSQGPADQSSASVAQAKIGLGIPTDRQLASVDPAQKVADRTKRAIQTTREARLTGPGDTIIR